MELITYRMFKNGQLIHQSTCPIILFSHIVPIRYENLYDYMEVEFDGIIKIQYPPNFNYIQNAEISEDCHNKLIKFKRYVEPTD
jgi:hypothetical protein